MTVEGKAKQSGQAAMMDGQPTTLSDAEAARIARKWAVTNAMLSRADVRPHSPSAFGGRSVASEASGGGRGLDEEVGQSKPSLSRLAAGCHPKKHSLCTRASDFSQPEAQEGGRN